MKGSVYNTVLSLSLCLGLSIASSARSAASGCSLFGEFKAPLHAATHRLDFTNADQSQVRPDWLNDVGLRPCLLGADQSVDAIELECTDQLSLIIFQSERLPESPLRDEAGVQALLEWLVEHERSQRLCNVWLPCFDLASHAYREDELPFRDSADNASFLNLDADHCKGEHRVSLSADGFRLTSQQTSCSTESKWAPGPELAMCFVSTFAYLVWDRAEHKALAVGVVKQLSDAE